MTEAELKNIVKIARENIPGLAERTDLEAQGNDALDFVDASVWSLKTALIAAYELGKSTQRQQGKWVCDGDDQGSWRCSHCGYDAMPADWFCTPYDEGMDFCPGCGAKMERGA